VAAFSGGDGSKLEVPFATGLKAARRLAAHCDVVVTWGIEDLAAILPADRPRVITVHHSDLESTWSNRTILTQLPLIDEIVCVNQDTAAQLATSGKPVHYIPNAIDFDRITPTGKLSEMRGDFGIYADSKIVLFGHRLSAEKRPQLAVEIAKQLPPDWTLIIVGDGPERQAVEAAASGCDRVRVVGQVDSLADWLAVSSCFLSLSTFEGFGLAVGEALAAGLPTVSTATGIAPRLATTLPTDASAAEWAAAITTAKPLVQPEAILERFSLERMVSAWASVIKKRHAHSD
jgi:glycosyltransferase involved in cell wall biosynthesis